jgi:general secretion pathway protein D
MTRRSAQISMRRASALPQSCCASLALGFALVLLLPTLFATAQAPVLGTPQGSGPPVSAAQNSPTGDLPPPQAPASVILPPSPAAATPAVPNDAPQTPVPPATADQAPKPARRVPKESEDLSVALERRGDLNLHDLSLNAALFTISEQWNINIVAGDVQGKVNGVFRDAPLREILDAILLSNGYNYRAVGKSLVISSITELGQVNPFFVSATIPVKTADIDEVTEGAKLLITPKGQVRAMKSAHSIVVLDFPDRIKMIRDFVATVDGGGSGRFATAENRNGIPLEVGYFRTQHITAKTAKDALVAVMSKEGRAAILEKEDRLLVTDYADNLEMIEKVIARIDRPRPQVRISALIYDISLQDIEKLGINWNHTIKGRIDANGDPQTSLGIDSVMEVPFPAGTAGSTLTFMNLSRHLDLTAVVEALQRARDARLLADPHVAVLENEEATFQSVQEIPYQQLTQTQQGGQIGTTAFKEAGIKLHVKPKIASEGLIRMDVMPEFSRLTGFTPGDNQPIIDVRSASTVLTVADRQTVVIGGLRQRGDVGDFNGVPYLKDLKLVGRLFRSRDTTVSESELVVFITPEIINYDEELNCREQLASDTINCRLAQIPQAEGCPPCCRRLPCDAVEVFNHAVPTDGPSPASEREGPPAAELPESQASLPDPRQPESLEPLSAARIPSAEFQFGVAGRRAELQALVAEGRLRRLPSVQPNTSQPAASAVATGTLFGAPTAAAASIGPVQNSHIRTAELPDPVIRR